MNVGSECVFESIVSNSLDNDGVGIGATSKIMKVLSKKYQCIDDHPKEFKDVNEELVSIKI